MDIWCAMWTDAKQVPLLLYTPSKSLIGYPISLIAMRTWQQVDKQCGATGSALPASSHPFGAFIRAEAVQVRNNVKPDVRAGWVIQGAGLLTSTNLHELHLYSGQTCGSGGLSQTEDRGGGGRGGDHAILLQASMKITVQTTSNARI